MKFFKNSWLGYPALAWLLLFFAGPLVLVVSTSFAERGTYGGIVWRFTGENIFRLLHPIFLEILLKSFGWAFFTTGMCLLIGFPMAWAMVTCTKKVRNVLLILVAVPFLMNLIIRVYALRLFFGFDGPAVQIATALGFEVDRFAFSQNIYLVVYGMVSSYLPFMLFPLYSGLERFDFQLIEAAYDLGMSPIRAVVSVVLPNNLRAVLNGSVLVFIPTLGEFVIPDLLGGAKNMLAGGLITEQFLKSRDWPFGSALSLGLILFVFATLFLITRLERRLHAGTSPA